MMGGNFGLRVIDHEAAGLVIFGFTALGVGVIIGWLIGTVF